MRPGISLSLLAKKASPHTSQSFHPFVSMILPSGRVIRNSPVSSSMFTRQCIKFLMCANTFTCVYGQGEHGLFPERHTLTGLMFLKDMVDEKEVCKT